jgi:hypothetical protein
MGYGISVILILGASWTERPTALSSKVYVGKGHDYNKVASQGIGWQPCHFQNDY